MTKVNRTHPVTVEQFDSYSTIVFENVESYSEGTRLEIRIPSQPMPAELFKSLESLGLRPSQVGDVVATIQDNLLLNYLLSRKV